MDSHPSLYNWLHSDLSIYKHRDSMKYFSRSLEPALVSTFWQTDLQVPKSM
jgi:hypothetical protein